MPRNATVYRVMIASPSDVMEERIAAREVILDWDAANSIDTAIVLEPILWETHSNPELGQRPQAILNRQLVEQADALIAIFWTRIGTPTGVAPSGTIEELEQFIESGRPAKLYFSSRSAPVEGIDPKQLQQVQDFRRKCKDRGLYASYRDLPEFRELLSRHIAQFAHSLSGAPPGAHEDRYPRKVARERSAYSVKADAARLRIQADNLGRLDRAAIKEAIDFLRGRQDRQPGPIQVLDVGCADGYVTESRFGKLPDIAVTGIDIDPTCIEIAGAEHARPNFTYQVLDVESATTDVDPCDLIFCGETLHHLRNPEAVLHRLWSRLRTPGVLLVRGSDDGFKLTYPPDEDLEWLLRSTHELRGSSDRQHGRKIFSQMKNLSPEPSSIAMRFQVDSTVGTTDEQRQRFFDDNYGFRLLYAEALLKSPVVPPRDQAFVTSVRNIVQAQRERFTARSDLFSLNLQNVGIAYKG